MLAEDRVVGSVERLFHLRKAPIVGALRPELLAVLAEASRPRVFRKGERLLVEGEPVGAAQFLVEGRVHLQRGERVIGHGEPGTALGEIGLVAAAPALLTATAETDALTLELHTDTCQDLIEDHFGILRHYLREVCSRIIDDWPRLPAGTPRFLRTRAEPPVPAPIRDLDLVERIFLLRQFNLFDRASINALAELARSMSEVHLEVGARLWSEGEAARHVVVVVAGEAEGRSRTGFRLQAGPGWPLGALESIATRPRWYDAQVSRRLTALTTEIEVLFDVLEDNLDLAVSILAAMSRWALQLQAQLGDEARDQQEGRTSFDVSRIGAADEAEEPTET